MSDFLNGRFARMRNLAVRNAPERVNMRPNVDHLIEDVAKESVATTFEREVDDAIYRGEDVEYRPGIQELNVTLSNKPNDEADLEAWLAVVGAMTEKDTNEISLIVGLD